MVRRFDGVPVAQRLERVAVSATMALNERVQARRRAGHPVMNLTAGEPDAPTPPAICEAAVRALHAGHTRYTPVAGIPELRERLAAAASEELGQSFSAREVMVTAGGKQGLYNFFMALLNPGDRVLIPTPAWVSFAEQVRLAAGQPVFVATRPEHAFFPTPEDLDALWDPACRALILNTPCNPTGQVIGSSLLAAITQWCVAHRVYLVLDATYARLTFPGTEYLHPLKQVPDARPWVITVGSFSKTYRMTGWRVGWVLAPAGWVEAMTVIQSHSTSNANSIAQWAALAALEVPHSEIEQACQRYQRRAHRVLEALRSLPGARPLEPRATFYVWVDISRWLASLGVDDQRFALHLLDEVGVGLVPGSAFQAPGHIRISVSVAEPEIEAALTALTDYCQRHLAPHMEASE